MNSKNVPIWAKRRPQHRAAMERGWEVPVRESLLYFSVKDAVPYFSPAGSLVQRNVLRAVGERAVDIVEAGTGGHVESML